MQCLVPPRANSRVLFQTNEINYHRHDSSHHFYDASNSDKQYLHGTVMLIAPVQLYQNEDLSFDTNYFFDKHTCHQTNYLFTIGILS